jgi:hypothetical protein
MTSGAHVSGTRWGSGHAETFLLHPPAFTCHGPSCAKLAADPTIRSYRAVALINHDRFGTIDTTSSPPASPHDGAVTESSAPPAIMAFNSGSVWRLYGGWRVMVRGMTKHLWHKELAASSSLRGGSAYERGSSTSRRCRTSMRRGS